MSKVNWNEEMKESERMYSDEFLLDEIKALKERVTQLEKQLQGDGK